MTIVLALAVLTVSASAIEDAPQTVKPSRVSIMCTKSGEHLGGLTKVCYYSCAGSEGALKEPAYEACPGWTPRWRLNHNSQFGPNKKAR
jgi:hypothetical protein